jgi:DNA-binding LacI/PurR family transcriptional regulator
VASANGRTTIFEVADGAGVSITTVSHVFSGKRHVNSETRRRVLEVADRLAYRPRATAQALATGRTNTLALQISVSGAELVLNPFFASLLPALSLAAIEREYAFVYVPPGAESASFVEPLVDQRRIDGALLVDPIRDDPFVLALERSNVAFASVGRILGWNSDYWVDNDHAAICRKVLVHLARRGYNRPALLTVPMELSYVADYTAAFRAAAAGSSEARIVVASDLSERAAEAAALESLTGSDPPDAFFCIHDQLGLGALRAAARAGRSVPDDIGVVGMTDSLLASHSDPPLTSVRVFPERAAAVAIDLLDSLLRGIGTNVPAIIPSRLIARASTARRG